MPAMPLAPRRRGRAANAGSDVKSMRLGARPDRRWLVWLCLALLVLPVCFAAMRSRSETAISILPTESALPTDREPITPIPDPPRADTRRLALGARLFNDRHLSGDGMRACSSCHDLLTNGAGGRPRGTTPDGSKLLFNTPTVFNAALNFRLDWEGNLRTLEEQAAASLTDRRTMASSWPRVLAYLRGNPTLRQQFERAFGHAPDRASLLNAIATFEGSLLTPGSRFDRWLGGDSGALSIEEKHGYHLFKSFGCVSCHQGVNVGGNLFERPGIFHPLASAAPGTAPSAELA